MINKNKVFTFLSILMAFIGLLAGAIECPAAFYRPDGTIQILSEYSGIDAPNPSGTRHWTVIPVTTTDGKVTMGFYLKDASPQQAICQLTFAATGSDRIQWQGIENISPKISDDGFLLVPGFPAPCDVLPVGDISEQGLYQDRNEAGGSVFVKSYQVTTRPVTPAEAVDSGWINDTMPDVGALVMVTATDKRGETVVRQLWPVNGAWWIYEETPIRRSWRIENK